MDLNNILNGNVDDPIANKSHATSWCNRNQISSSPTITSTPLGNPRTLHPNYQYGETSSTPSSPPSASSSSSSSSSSPHINHTQVLPMLKEDQNNYNTKPPNSGYSFTQPNNLSTSPKLAVVQNFKTGGTPNIKNTSDATTGGKDSMVSPEVSQQNQPPTQQKFPPVPRERKESTSSVDSYEDVEGQPSNLAASAGRANSVSSTPTRETPTREGRPKRKSTGSLDTLDDDEDSTDGVEDDKSINQKGKKSGRRIKRSKAPNSAWSEEEDNKLVSSTPSQLGFNFDESILLLTYLHDF